MVRRADFSNPGKDVDLNIAKGPCLAGKRSVVGLTHLFRIRLQSRRRSFSVLEGGFVPHVKLASPLSAADFGPVGGPGSSEARALAKGQDRVQCVAAFPIVGQFSFHQSEGTRGPGRAPTLLTARSRIPSKRSGSTKVCHRDRRLKVGRQAPGAEGQIAHRCMSRQLHGPERGHRRGFAA